MSATTVAMAKGENVRVFARLRPVDANDDKLVWTHEGGRIKGHVRDVHVDLDHIFGMDDPTDHVYHIVARPIVQSVVEGYHGCIFAYGQTSSGKTHTMNGFVRHAVQDAFDLMRTNVDQREYLCRVSYLEIYNEQIHDLLAVTSSTSTTTHQPIVRMYHDRHGKLHVKGLQELVVSSTDDIATVLQGAQKNRHVAYTNCNDNSSRSHTILQLTIESRSPQHGTKNVRISSLNLVDLAGSENIKLAKTTGAQKLEGAFINKSLLTLGQIISKLSEEEQGNHRPHGPPQHLPYRNSKLTRFLQPALDGHAKIAVCCTIHPIASCFEESVSTLQFGTRAKKIRQKFVNINEVSENAQAALIQQYRREIEELKQQLAQAQAERQPSRSDGLSGRHADQRHQGNMTSEEDLYLIEAISKLERLIIKSNSALRSSSKSNSMREPGASHDGPDTTGHGIEERVGYQDVKGDGFEEEGEDDVDGGDDDDDDDDDEESLLQPDEEEMDTHHQEDDIQGSPSRSDSPTKTHIKQAPTPPYPRYRRKSSVQDSSSETDTEMDDAAQIITKELQTIHSQLHTILAKKKQSTITTSSSPPTTSKNDMEASKDTTKLGQYRRESILQTADRNFLLTTIDDQNALLDEFSQAYQNLEQEVDALRRDNERLVEENKRISLLLQAREEQLWELKNVDPCEESF